MIDGSEKRNQLAFELQNSHVCEKHSNHLMLVFFFPGLVFITICSPRLLVDEGHG